MNTTTIPRLVLIVVGVLLSAAVMAAGGAAASSNRVVTDGGGTAAVLGVVTRIPAETTGGALYADASVNLDKARAHASAFYGGFLMDAFLRSSVEGYEDLSGELDGTAENPEQSSPTEEVVGNPDRGSGRVGHLRAAAPTRQHAEAVVTLASDSGGSPAISFDASTAETVTRVLDDETVVVESVATITGLRIADVAEFASIESRAVVRVAVDAEPEVTFTTRIGGATVGGHPVTLGKDGMIVADEEVLDSLQLSELDPVFETLAEQGLTFETVPALVEAEPGGARVEGAALRFRYEAKKNDTTGELLSNNPMYQVVPLPPEFGYDEEFLVGHVTASAVSRRPADLRIDLDLGDDVVPPDVSATELAESPTTSDVSGGGTLPVSPPMPDDPPSPEPPMLAGPVGTSSDDTATGSEPSLDLAMGARTVDPNVERILGAYKLLFLFALVGIVAPRILHRTGA